MSMDKTLTAPSVVTSTVCGECKKQFSKVSNLRTHVKTKHPDKLDILCPNKRNRSAVVTCTECNTTFAKEIYLRKHVRKKHADKLDILCKRNVKDYKCAHCDEHFNKLSDFQNHKKSHKVVRALKCPLCEFSDSCKENLITHYKEMHEIQIEIENNEFSTYEMFQSWKCKIEEQTSSSFVNNHGSYNTKNYSKVVYNCHRSGNARFRGNGVRHLKTQGSNKIDGYCPAGMIVFRKDEKCEVQFIKTHIGHNNELGRLFLNASHRQQLARKIAEDIPLKNILDEIKNSALNSTPGRLHLIKKKDLYNIKRCFKLNNLSVPDASDVITDDSCLIAMEDDSSCEPHSEQLLDAEKAKFIANVLQKVKNISSLEELYAIKITAPIKPTLDALRGEKGPTSITKVASKTSCKKNITLQRRFVGTKKKCKKVSKNVVVDRIPVLNLHINLNTKR